MEKKVHLKDPRFNTSKYHFDVRLSKKPEQLTGNPKEVTCLRCLKEMRK